MNVKSPQFIKFCITGTINAGVDFLVYLSLTRFIDFWSHHLVVATIIAFIVASTNSYFLNKYWTFNAKNGSHKTQYPKFMVVVSLGLVINAICFYFFVHIINLHDIVSKIIVAGIVLFWNYTLNRLWTFKPLNEKYGL